MTKKIGILTSGGDCAGLNAVLRAVTHRAIDTYGWEVYGIKQGTMGLIKRPIDVQRLSVADFDIMGLRLGGTILGTTNFGDPFSIPQEDGSVVDGSDLFIQGFKELGIDALIGVGGDGSLKILETLAKKGNIPLIGIPKTIDNDIGTTENSIGFVTAVEVATEALDRLQPTAASHDRVMILEVMGRDAGHIALNAGIAGGADVILLPEIPYKLDEIAAKVKSIAESGRNFALVIVAEAVKTEDKQPLEITYSSGQTRYGGIGHYLADRITEKTGAETRFMVLGHVQRGSAPYSRDRVLASAFGVKAVDLIHQEKFGRIVAWQNRQVIDAPISQAVEEYQAVDPKGTLIETAKGLGIYVGSE